MSAKKKLSRLLPVRRNHKNIDIKKEAQNTAGDQEVAFSILRFFYFFEYVISLNHGMLHFCASNQYDYNIHWKPGGLLSGQNPR